MSRRVFAFICLLLAVFLPATSLIGAQKPEKVYRIGYLTNSAGIRKDTEEVIRQALRDLGYIEGQNLGIEWRFSKGKLDLLPSLAAELVRLKVDCIVALGVAPTRAAKEATNTIPIVMGNADDDPVRHGLVASLARPGGNVTGFTNIGSDLAGKRLELLKETAPKASRVAILWDPKGPGGAGHARETKIAASALGVELQPVEVRSKIPKIGWLGVRPAASDPGLEEFGREFRALGYVEGKNIVFEYRSADDKLDRLPALADELVRLKS